MNTAPIAVRLATADDVPILLDMMVDFNRGEQITWTPREGEPALRTLLGDQSLGLVGLCEAGGATVGYFVLTYGYDLEWNGRDAFLTELYLVPSSRRRGLGPTVLRRIEVVAKEKGVRALHLMVRPENKAAKRLYEGAGYVSPPRIFLSKELG